MAGSEWLDVTLGLLQLTLALVVLRRLRGFGRAFPWLAALIVFFALRGLRRLYSAFSDDAEAALGVATDVALLVVLALLLFGLDRTARGLRYATDAAAAREHEYARALVDYRSLVRHRIANPLAVIRGGAATLREVELDAEQRAELVAAIETAARELEGLALEPVADRPEERSLRPTPDVEQP